MRKDKPKDFLGNGLKVGDDIMYITNTHGYQYQNYGVIHKIYWPKRESWMSDQYRIEPRFKIFKLHDTSGYLESARYITLTYPTMFKVGAVVEMDYGQATKTEKEKAYSTESAKEANGQGDDLA